MSEEYQRLEVAARVVKRKIADLGRITASFRLSKYIIGNYMAHPHGSLLQPVRRSLILASIRQALKLTANP